MLFIFCCCNWLQFVSCFEIVPAQRFVIKLISMKVSHVLFMVWYLILGRGGRRRRGDGAVLGRITHRTTKIIDAYVALVDGHLTKIQFRPQSLIVFFFLSHHYVFLFYLYFHVKYVFCIDNTFLFLSIIPIQFECFFFFWIAISLFFVIPNHFPRIVFLFKWSSLYPGTGNNN